MADSGINSSRRCLAQSRFQDNKKSSNFLPEYVFTRVIFRNAVPESSILAGSLSVSLQSNAEIVRLPGPSILTQSIDSGWFGEFPSAR